jgi:TolB-like protein/Flp pilus assembly protein TadD
VTATSASCRLIRRGASRDKGCPGDSLGTGDATQSSSPLAVDHPPLSQDVFVSYASQDAAVANSVVEALERQGIRCWIAPRDVAPGALYADGIIRAINEAKVFVLVLSASSIASKHVGKEVERASSKGRPVIALKVDAAPLTTSLEYFLSESQWIEVGAGGLEAATTQLAEAIRRYLDSSSPAPRANADQPRSRPATGSRNKWLVAGGVAVLFLALSYFVTDKFWFSRQGKIDRSTASVAPVAPGSALTIPEKSVAVLPFVDMSEKKDQEYFSDGLSEELIDMLTKVPELRVPARTSSFYFKGKQTRISDLAKELGVAHVLEGSVRKSGKTLRVTVQLIRADTGYHLWSESYDRPLDDIFKVQDEIAGAVVKALRVSLLGSGATRAAPTSSAASYNLLLQAKYFLVRSTQEDQEKALNYYEQVVRSDPTSAEAWAGVSRVTANLSGLGVVGWREGRDRALQAAQRAVELDPELSDAHIALGKVYMNFDQNFTAAKLELAKALELAPHSPFSLFWMAAVLTSAGDLPHAVMLYEQSIAEDPLDGEAYLQIGEAQRFAGHYNEAEMSYRRAIDLVPERSGLHSALGIALLNQHKTDSALEAIAREPDAVAREGTLAWAYQTLGRTEEARSALNQLETTRADTDAYDIAAIYALRSDVDHAFAWLDRAYRQHEGLMDIKVDPSFEGIRRDPRYGALLRKLNLPEYRPQSR